MSISTKNKSADINAGMVACKIAAAAPERVASLSLLSTTRHGWHMAVSMLRCPLTCIQVRLPPFSSISTLFIDACLPFRFMKRESLRGCDS